MTEYAIRASRKGSLAHGRVRDEALKMDVTATTAATLASALC